MGAYANFTHAGVAFYAESHGHFPRLRSLRGDISNMSANASSIEQDAQYWRRRYYEHLETLESEIDRLKDVEEQLRRLASRACLGLEGQDAALNEVADAVRVALRKPCELSTLRGHLEQLTAAIENHERAKLQPSGASGHAFEDRASAPRSEPLSVLGVLTALLQQIQFDEGLSEKAESLGERIAKAEEGPPVAELIGDVAALVNAQRDGLQDSLLKFQALFGQINGRLAEMFGHVARDAEAFEAAQQSGKTLELQLMGEVNTLGQTVRQSDDLELLQQQVDARLEKIEQHVEDFRVREREQREAYQERAEHMRERISELEQQAQSLERAMRAEKRRALIDPVTGIPNRQALMRQLAVIRGRDAEWTPVCLAVWDVDHFKTVNDSFGHKAGDRALRLVSRKLQSALRAGDFLARYGGEEFVMLLYRMRLDAAVPFLDELRQKIAGAPFHYADQPVSLTLSCGVTELSAGHDVDGAFERADAALYESKHSGRNRISSG